MPVPFSGVTGEVSIAMVRRPWIAASFSILLGFGCHAGPPKDLARTEPSITRSDLLAEKYIAKHNKNAAAIRSLEASPSITVVGDRGGRANGHLALEGKRNFRLEVEAFHKPLADIGSNDQEFWFWVKDDKEKAIYVCDHTNTSQLAVTLQPDWIMEAMGLREFSDTEAKTVHAKPGEAPGTLILTQSRKDPRGQIYTKETLVVEKDGEIREHKLFSNSGARKELLASAIVSKYMYIKYENTPAKNTDVSDGDPISTPTQTLVQIPGNVRLTWVKENLSIDIAMTSAKVNPTFAPRRKMALFTEPPIPGATRRDLAMLTPPTSASAPSSRVYESRPIPRSGISLGNPQPSPISAEGTTRRAIDPVPLSADLSSTPAQPVGVVGALVPSGSDDSAVRASSGGRLRPAPLER